MREKGVVIVSHGFGEHSGSYGELAGRLERAGYGCVVFSQRGHGELPAKRRGVIPGYSSFIEDISARVAEVKEQKPNVPVALYGHSMGGNIAANFLLRQGQSGVACAVLESPWLGLYKKPGPVASGLAKCLGTLSPKFAIVNPLVLGDVTSDAEKADWLKNDPLYHNRISLRMFTGIKDGCSYALQNAPRLTAPTYIAFARDERIVSNPAILDFAKAAGQTVTLKEYESCHAIHNDVKREDFFKDMIAFLDTHCPSAAYV